jgi:hypothetical protein
LDRKDCEKLLDACINAYLLLDQANREGLDQQFAQETAGNLREVIIAVMADEKKPVYRDNGITVGGLDWGKVTTVPTHVTQPVVTCDVTAATRRKI